jgi:putative acyl-CoA dehydrogenase
MLPRLYRQAPLNSIWEGSGNIQCLDVLRALTREPDTGAALLAEIDAAQGLDADFDAHARQLRPLLAGGALAEVAARRLVEDLALALQASVLLRTGSPIAEAFCRSRLGGTHGLVFGTLPPDAGFESLLARVFAASRER